jgi:hypothetical protein
MKLGGGRIASDDYVLSAARRYRQGARDGRRLRNRGRRLHTGCVALLAAAGDQRELDAAKAKLEAAAEWLASGVFPGDVATLYAAWSTFRRRRLRCWSRCKARAIR